MWGGTRVWSVDTLGGEVFLLELIIKTRQSWAQLLIAVAQSSDRLYILSGSL